MNSPCEMGNHLFCTGTCDCDCLDCGGVAEPAEVEELAPVLQMSDYR